VPRGEGSNDRRVRKAWDRARRVSRKVDALIGTHEVGVKDAEIVATA
jgi:hypothetical protein